MTKLEELKKIVSDQFEKAEASMKTKEYIDEYAKMNSLINEVEKENKALVDSNAELTKNYVDLVRHGAGVSAVPPKNENGECEPPDFDKMLKELTEKKEA